MHLKKGHCLAQKQPVYEAKHSWRYKQAAMVPVYICSKLKPQISYL